MGSPPALRASRAIGADAACRTRSWNDAAYRRVESRARAIRVHHRFSYCVSGFLDRARELSGCPERPVADHGQAGLSRRLQLLEKDIRRRLRHGRRFRHRHELSDRHELERVVLQGGTGSRSVDGLRGTVGVFSRGRLSWRGPVWPRTRWPHAALHRCFNGRHRHLYVRVLDSLRQQLDADASRLRVERQGAIHRGRLVGGHIQPVISLPSRPHGSGRLSDDGLCRGRRRRLSSPARPRQHPRASHVLHGDVDGRDRCAIADRRWRRAWTEHAGASAR